MTQQNHWKDTLWPTINASGETLVDLPGTTAMVLPIGSTAERPASPVNGMLRYNTDLADFEMYNGGWAILASIAGVTLSKLEDGDLNTEIYVENFTGVDDNNIVFTMGDNSGTFVMPPTVLDWSTTGFTIDTPAGNAANAGVALTITTGDGNVAAAGGAIDFIAGNGGTNGTGGDIGLTAGDAGASAGFGGIIALTAGDSTLSGGGVVLISAGDSGGGIVGANVQITAGDADANDGGTVIVRGGDTVSGSGIGGEVLISTGDSLAAAGAPINLTAGTGDGAANPGGAITVQGGEGDPANGTGGSVSVVGGQGGTGTGGGGLVSIIGGSPQSSGDGGDVNVSAGPAAGIASGGALGLFGGNADTTGVGGTITVTGGDGGSVSGVGGAVLINAGDAGTGDVGGAVTITTGDGDGTGIAGAFNLITGDGGAGAGSVGGIINITSGTGVAGSGAINITTGGSVGTSADITLTAGTGAVDGSIQFVTGAAARFGIAADGTLEAKTASYETLVLADNDMPNKKYVDDSITAAVHPYDLHAFMGPPLAGTGAGAIVYRWTPPRPISLGTGGHFAYCDGLTTATVGAATFDLLVSSPGGTPPGPSIGTVTFAIGALTGVVAPLGPLVIGPGDELILVYTTPDTGGTLANVVLGILADA